MYTSILNNTQTSAHTIAPVVNQPTTLAEKLSSARGTGHTGSAIKKVANFIGMDEAALAIQHTPITPGLLSVDLELEVQARRQLAQRINALEQAEQLRRLTLPDDEMKRKVLAIFTSRRIQDHLAAPPRRNNERIESSRFLKCMRANLAVIEEAERSRRLADMIGESARRFLAKEVTYKVLIGLQSPQLRNTKHMTNAPWPTEYNSALEVFGGAALDVSKHFAGRAVVSAYQVADFALRVGKFFGPKALAKGAEFTEKAVATSYVVGDQALQTGHSALVKSKSLGQVAAQKTVSLGQTALMKTQSLGSQAALGAHTIAQKATDVVVDAAVGAQHLTEQAIEGAKNLKDQTQSAVVDAAHAVQDWATTPEPTLGWSQVHELEEQERMDRNIDNVDPARLMLAMRTSAIIRDHSGSSTGSLAYGTRVIEEMERFGRRSNQTYARANANRVASVIGAYRQSLFESNRAPAVLTEAIKSMPVWPSRLANASAPSIRIAREVPRSESSRGFAQPAPVAMAQTNATPMSAQSPFVSQTAMDAFAKAFQQNVPAIVYRPAM